TTPIKPASWSYAEGFVPEDEVLAAARARADEVGVVPIGSGGGAALRFLASVLDARAVVEIGTGTGVSGLWLLRGMRAGGGLTPLAIQGRHPRPAHRRQLRPGLRRRRQGGVPRLPQGGPAAAAPRRRGGVRQRAVARPGRRPRPARRGHRLDPRPRPHDRRARRPGVRAASRGRWAARREE